ncbi:GNAT family N-acetyltransferase [Dactylosporangium sp. NPDC000244]|uniref:GNAT family N-acetyltransferase n=1 Tax=Dactylosporangium sp. NPDC000244 TaxID=3154365 RepID=UPI00332357AA
MTDQHPTVATAAPRTAGAEHVIEATALAEATADAAGIAVAELGTIEEMTEACALLDHIWRPDPGDPLITLKLLKGLSHSGSYVAGVFADGKLAGACVGFLASDGLHSHIAGIDSTLRGRHAGLALKLHQRAWALRRGIGLISWTFDPLVSRNAYFNLTKLGAVPTQYLANFYGAMHDEINAGTETDRLLVHWDLTSGVAAPPVDGALDRAVDGLSVGPDGGPVRGRVDGRRVLVAVPADIERLRRADPAAAGRWRAATREVLGGLMATGHTVTGFTRDGRYVIEGQDER